MRGYVIKNENGQFIKHFLIDSPWQGSMSYWEWLDFPELFKTEEECQQLIKDEKLSGEICEVGLIIFNGTGIHEQFDKVKNRAKNG